MSNRIMYRDANGDYKHAERLEIVSTYTGESYGEVGEVTDIKDTLTGEYLKVGDVVFYDIPRVSMNGISIVVKNNRKKSSDEPLYFIMGVLWKGEERETIFDKIIKTSTKSTDVDFSKYDYHLEFKAYN